MRAAWRIGLIVCFVGMATPAAGLRHYQCYDSRTSTTFATVPGTGLLDRYGPMVVDVGRPEYQCAPADAGGDPDAPSDPVHLVSYTIRQSDGRFTRVPSQRVVNQLHDVLLDVVKPVRLLVPSVSSFTGTPPAGPDGTVSHFTCYRVRRSRGAAVAASVSGVQVTTIFEQGTPVALDLAKPKRLCVPTDPNGEDPGVETDSLLCYRTRSVGSFGEFDVFLQNRFGPQQYRIRGSRRELCVPSLVMAP
jgi:hypothetical protein